MVISAPSAYNMILRRLTLNDLAAAVSYPQLCMKFPLSDDRTTIVRGDQETARKCYAESARVGVALDEVMQFQDAAFLDLGPRLYDPAREEKRIILADNLEEIKIGPADHQKTRIRAVCLSTPNVSSLGSL